MTTGSRRIARERALSLLYEAEIKGQPAGEVVAEAAGTPDPFAVDLVHGTVMHLSRIDELIASNTHDWSVDRLAVVDRLLLRMATYELLEESDTPTAVVISEAIELAKSYSTEESSRFVNGVLAAIARAVRPSPS